MAQFRDLIITGPSRFLGDMYLNGGLNIGGDLNVEGETSLNQSLFVGKDLTVGSGFNVLIDELGNFRSSLGVTINPDENIISSTLDFIGNANFLTDNSFYVSGQQIELYVPEDNGSIKLSMGRSGGVLELGEIIEIPEPLGDLVLPKINVNNLLYVYDDAQFQKNVTFYGQEANTEADLAEIKTEFINGPVYFSWIDTQNKKQTLGCISGGNLDFTGYLIADGDYSLLSGTTIIGKNKETIEKEIAANPTEYPSFSEYMGKQSKLSVFGNSYVEGNTLTTGNVTIDTEDNFTGLSVYGSGNFSGDLYAKESFTLENGGEDIYIKLETYGENLISPILKTDLANSGFYLNPLGENFNDGLAIKHEANAVNSNSNANADYTGYNLYWLGELLATQTYVNSKSNELENKVDNALANDYLSKIEGGIVQKPVEVQGTFTIGETNPSSGHRAKFNYDDAHGCVILSFA
jgi:hypothetical protein